jgi:hypothetical protein
MVTARHRIAPHRTAPHRTASNKFDAPEHGLRQPALNQARVGDWVYRSSIADAGSSGTAWLLTTRLAHNLAQSARWKSSLGNLSPDSPTPV